MVASGKWTSPTKEDIYSRVIGMETIQLGFVLAAIAGLRVAAADIGNAFLYSKTKEKVYVIAGPEFGEHAGKRMIIEEGLLYGLRSSSAGFHEHLPAKLRSMGFRPSKADPKFWIRLVDEHYEYLAMYVDDILIFSKDPMPVLEEIQNDYVLKGVGEPEYYLLESTSKTYLNNSGDDNKGVNTGLSARTYMENALLPKMAKMVGQDIRTFKTPMDSDYHPEIDDSEPLNDTEHSKYRALVGSANWIITLGRFDIQYAVTTLAKYSMKPRAGRYKAMIRVFGYLKAFPKGLIIIDPNMLDTEQFSVTKHDNWMEFYPDSREEIPSKDMPKPMGKPARITIFVDADHAHDQATRRSKQQNLVETSTYGSDMVAARTATDIGVSYRYMLRMLGVPIDGPIRMFGDNSSVVINTTVPSSHLKTKVNAIAYHRVRECIAADILEFYHSIKPQTNFADVLTKLWMQRHFTVLLYHPCYFENHGLMMERFKLGKL
eukprot:Nitzschia sp. Nitz4//scaffold145_size56662//50639//52106//NITZ4_006565-RA/size56662-processed-gene-0.32-mRNA-1//-1//CDS//3329536601//8752//frame0